MATELILVRHGETLWNRESRFQGTADIELSSVGVKQAESLAERFRDWELDMVYASNLQRAFKTAEIVAQLHNIEVEEVAELSEANFGVWEGLTFEEIEEEYGEKLTAWLADPVEVEVPQGENLFQVQQRAKKALREIKQCHQEERVLVVAHGGTIRALLAELLEMSLSNFWRIEQSNTAVNIVRYYDDDPILSLINCTRHLERVEE
ncbi:MAG: alpha-ribazole phosphatase [Bacillota bacterium]